MKRIIAVIVIILLLMPLNQTREEGINAKNVPTKEDVFGFIFALQKKVFNFRFSQKADLLEEIVAKTGKIDYFDYNYVIIKDAIEEFYKAEGISYNNSSIDLFVEKLNSTFTSDELYAISLLLFSYADVLNAVTRKQQIEEILETWQNVRKATYYLINCSINESLSDEYNLIIMGCKRNEKYASNYKFVIDFGGNDSYETGNNSFLLDMKGGDEYKGLSGNNSINLVFDLAGNDIYRRIPYAVQGIDFLVDAEGNDEYFGSVAYSYENGMAVLVDAEGNDIYDGKNYSQGYSNNGFSLLIDMRGDDIYKASNYCQASSENGGVSCLLDLYGNDAFFAADHAQSYATGLPRTSLSIFMNLAGDDYYEAKDFSQGYGEKGGMAFFFDFLGEDNYYASQFSQASSSWLGLAVLLDGDGKNKFSGGFFSQGNQRWGGYSFFLNDFNADDIYEILTLPEKLDIDLSKLLSNFL